MATVRGTGGHPRGGVGWPGEADADGDTADRQHEDDGVAVAAAGPEITSMASRGAKPPRRRPAAQHVQAA